MRRESIQQLEKAYLDRDMLMVELNADPSFDRLRSDPRFVQLLHSIGLAG
jgi:hypothetical protein